MSNICIIGFSEKSYAEMAHAYLTQRQFYCFSIDRTDDNTHFFFGFVITTDQLPTQLQRILTEFYVKNMEIYPFNERYDYQNYCHRLYYNDYELMEKAVEYVIDENIDEHVMAFQEDDKSTYTWRVVFCTKELIGQEQITLITTACKPESWIWNEPVTGNVSPTSIFK